MEMPQYCLPLPCADLNFSRQEVLSKNFAPVMALLTSQMLPSSPAAAVICQTGYRGVGRVTWVQNLKSKYLRFHFEFAEGQNTKIHAKYQDSFQAQNAKISAVSTPILTAKAAFFSIFHALSEKSAETD